MSKVNFAVIGLKCDNWFFMASPPLFADFINRLHITIFQKIASDYFNQIVVGYNSCKSYSTSWILFNNQ